MKKKKKVEIKEIKEVKEVKVKSEKQGYYYPSLDTVK